MKVFREQNKDKNCKYQKGYIKYHKAELNKYKILYNKKNHISRLGEHCFPIQLNDQVPLKKTPQ